MKITVGIPAYNEAQNIEALLKAILGQRLQNDLSLCQIVVVSDGSTDATPAIVAQYRKRDSRIELHKLPERLGKPTAINEIFSLAKGELIVLLDADTLPNGDKFLSELTRPFRDNVDVGITAAIGVPLYPKTLVERAAVFSTNVRHRLIKYVPYLAFNVALAVSAEAAETLRLPANVIGDDAYIYFKIKSRGLRAIVTPNAKILYEEPKTLCDFMMQRKKYDTNVIQMKRIFGHDAAKQMSVPRKLWGAFVRETLTDPVGGIAWLLLRGLVKLRKSADIEKVRMGYAASTKGSLNMSSG